MSIKGAIVLVAKHPTPGKSKTRLSTTVGPVTAAQIAKAMLMDVLTALHSHEALRDVTKILLFAPDESQEDMKRIINETLGNEKASHWKLLPMLSGQLTSSDLGSKLADGLVRARECVCADGAVAFIGMDSPELPVDEIVHGLVLSETKQQALLCPAEDGGYGLLCVPPSAPTTIFCGVRWSHPLTAVSQLKALTDTGVTVKLGRLMNDIDEMNDLVGLVNRINDQHSDQYSVANDVLSSSAGREPVIKSRCENTLKVLESNGLLPTKKQQTK